MKNVLAVLIGFTFLPLSALAQTFDPLTVDFNPDPLFSEAAFMPHDSTKRTFTAANNTDSAQNIYVRFVENTQEGNIANAITIEVTSMTGGILKAQTLNEWFSEGVVYVGRLNPKEERTFEVTASFASADNNHQGSSVGFDVCIGLSSGEEQCVDEVDNPKGGGGQFGFNRMSDEVNNPGDEGVGGNEDLGFSDLGNFDVTTEGDAGSIERGGELNLAPVSANIQLPFGGGEDGDAMPSSGVEETQAAAAFLGLPEGVVTFMKYASAATGIVVAGWFLFRRLRA